MRYLNKLEISQLLGVSYGTITVVTGRPELHELFVRKGNKKTDYLPANRLKIFVERLKNCKPNLLPRDYVLK